MEKYKISRHINDLSGSLDLNKDSILNAEQSFLAHYEAWWDQIVMVILESLEWGSLKTIWTKIFNDNQLWDKEKNNWLLLIVTKKEKKLRIIVWRGIKRKYSIPVLRAIVENKLRSIVNIGDYERLIQVWLEVTTNESYRKKINTSEKIYILLYLSPILLFLLFTLYVFINWVAIVFCNLLYYNLNSFIIWLGTSTLFIYTLYRYFKDKQQKERRVKMLFWIFILWFFWVLGNNIYLEVNNYSPEKKVPEWCEIKKENKTYNSKYSWFSDNDYSSDYESSSSDFGWWWSTDGYWYGD